jgi:hypothetical protein
MVASRIPRTALRWAVAVLVLLVVALLAARALGNTVWATLTPFGLRVAILDVQGST